MITVILLSGYLRGARGQRCHHPRQSPHRGRLGPAQRKGQLMTYFSKKVRINTLSVIMITGQVFIRSTYT